MCRIWRWLGGTPKQAGKEGVVGIREWEQLARLLLRQ